MTARANADDLRNIRSVLIHKPDHLGDVLCAAPAIECLRNAAPDARFSAAVMYGPGEILQALGLADEILEMAGPDWWARSGAARHLARCREAHFDLVVNFRHDMRDILAVTLMGARCVCTYTHRGIGTWHRASAPPPSPSRSELLNHLALIRVLGLNAEYHSGSSLGRIRPSAIDGFRGDGSWIAFHPFARTPAKSWPVEHARAFVQAAIERGIGVRLIGASENMNEAEKIAVSSGRFINHVGKTSLAELMACVGAVDALVCTDSGPGHFGPLVGTPVVTLASGTNDVARWAPWGATVIQHNVVCAPCHKEICQLPDHPCMRGLSPDRVVDAVSRLPGFA